MNFKIENQPVFTTLSVQMSSGEMFRSETGAMISMSPTIDLKAKTQGKGIFGALKAVVGGESLFISEYTATGDGELVVAPSTPGDIIQIELKGNTVFCQRGGYLCGTPELDISTQGSLKAMFSGEDLFLQKISGTGTVFLNSYGAVFEKELNGNSYIVDTGHIVAFEETISYKIKKASKGIFSSIASGEGLVCEYSGTGKIWVQTRNIPALASAISPYLPKR